MPSSILRLCTILVVLLLASGCSQDEPAPPPATATKPTAPKIYTCSSCHPHSLDKAHEFACTVCHQGKENVLSQEEAHNGLISRPAHPEHMASTCAPCHAQQVTDASHSLHFTSANEINSVRRAFGAETDLARAEDIPVHAQITTPLQLVDDLLRRRCLRCHISYDGDPYAETLRGTGCAACHLEFRHSSLVSHAFIKKTPDSQCLHCHNSNFVGADYYGRYEHDLHWDYRTPYKKDGSEADRPYGVEYHQLATDVHKKAGLACIDCHQGGELMATSTTTCRSCHEFTAAKQNNGLQLAENNGTVILSLSHKKITVPQLHHPAHAQYRGKVACAVCHSQWSYTDEGTHLFRQDDEDYDPWEAISVQGSFEVEHEVYTNINLAGYPYPFMSDKLTGKTTIGLWHKGFELRRWEFPIICADDDGILQICRPILDLHLSWVDEESEVIMDNITPNKTPRHGLLPYTPHTTGKAGPFYRQRLKTNLHLLEQPLNMDKAPGLNPAMKDTKK